MKSATTSGSAKRRSRRSKSVTGAAKRRRTMRTEPTGHRPRKRFGQHFLEPSWVTKVVNALEGSPEDTFLEIGPGRGALTIPLTVRAKHVIAVEIDRDLAASLEHRQIPNLQVLRSDILEVDLADALRDERLPVRVAGNLPYNISSPILFALLD